MAGLQSPDFERQLGKVKRSLERWRQAGQGRRIPEDIWNKAAKVAAQHGVSRVATALNLDFYALKERASKEETAQTSALVATNPVAATFLELLAPPPVSQALGRCSVEVESAAGARMRVEVECLELSGLLNLVRDFTS